MAKLKLNKELQDKICKDIEHGTPMKYASISNGICKSTFYNWYNKGEHAKSGKYHNFYVAIEEAKSKAIALKCEFIHKQAQENWHACAWWLERVAPEEFLKKEQYQIDANLEPHNGLKELGEAIRNSKDIRDAKEMNLTDVLNNKLRVNNNNNIE